MNWSQLSIQFAIGGTLSFAICYTVMRSLIKVQREHIKELGEERNDYRNKLHECREKATADGLRLTELQSRPDLQQLGGIIRQNSEALLSLSEQLTGRNIMFDRIEQAFQQTTAALAKLSLLIEKRGNGHAVVT